MNQTTRRQPPETIAATWTWHRCPETRLFATVLLLLIDYRQNHEWTRRTRLLARIVRRRIRSGRRLLMLKVNDYTLVNHCNNGCKIQ